MTVQEFIDKLHAVDPDKDVFFFVGTPDSTGWYELQEITEAKTITITINHER